MRPIQHTEHGQYGYAKRTHCDCELCVSCVRRYDKERRLRLYRGQSNRVDSTEARLHVEYLVAAGITYGQIAAATGEKVKESQIRRLIEGNPRNGRQPVRFLYPQTIEALLAVTYRRAASQESKVSPVGTRRRIAALNYMGYGTIDIARLMGVTEEAVRGWTDRDVVLVSTVKRVKEFYDTYSMKPGTNERMRWRAYRQDFVSPMAWDDDTIDDPATEPFAASDEPIVDEVAIRRAMHGDQVTLTRAERLEAVRLLTDAGHSSADIAARLGQDKRAVVRDRATVREVAS